MSRERARAREERERVAAQAEAARIAEAQRAARRTARRQSLTGWIPMPHPGQSGAWAARRRSQVSMTLALVFAINLLVWFFSDDWALRTLVLVVSVLGAPVLYTVLYRKD